MKKNNLTKIVAMTIGVLLVIVIGFVGFNAVKNNGSATNNLKPSNPSESSAPAATTTPTQEPTNPAVTKEKYEEDKNKVTGAKDVDFFSKSDVEEVLTIAQTYARQSLSDRYFLSGKWIEDGIPMDQLNNIMGPYYSQDLRDEILAFKNGTPASKLLAITFYIGDNGKVSPSPLCALFDPETLKDGEVPPACPDGNVTISEMKFQPVTNADGVNALNVKFTASAKIPVTINPSTPATTDVTYTYNLDFIPNPNYEATTNPNKFVINYYDVSTVAKKVEAVK